MALTAGENTSLLNAGPRPLLIDLSLTGPRGPVEFNSDQGLHASPPKALQDHPVRRTAFRANGRWHWDLQQLQRGDLGGGYPQRIRSRAAIPAS